jgi:hypothetical protein
MWSATMTTTSVRRLAVVIALAAPGIFFSGSDSGTVFGQAANCGMLKNDTPVIFCDTFDQPSPVTNRSGQLNGVIWGVSRIAGRGVEWKDSILDGCNGPQAASASNASDVIICNGQLRQSTHDNADVTALAMYPKQPFDWAGRTGTVAFDVTNDTSGTHGAWPEFWITNLPIPAPNSHFPQCDTCSFSQHALGIRFAAERGSCGSGWRADSAVVIRNWGIEDRNIFENTATGMRIRERGCASLSSGPNGGLNHVEIRISQNYIEVWASDAGSRTLKLINTIENANLSFSRGLIWIGDYHYAAFKAHEQNPSVPNQTNHTYTWDNVAFDGPATYRDLSYDVLDRVQPGPNGTYRIGWETSASSPANLNTLPMTTQAINTATGAYLLFNFGPYNTPSSFTYVINGHSHTAVNPQPSNLIGWRAMALPIPDFKNKLIQGPQNIRLSTNADLHVQNVNIVLIAAAPVPGFVIPSPPINVRIQSSE